MSSLIILFAMLLAPLQAKPLPLRLEALVATSDSFSIRVQGNEMGWQRHSIQPTADGFTLHEETSMPGVSQKTEVRLARNAAVQAVNHTGNMRGQAASIQLTYANGRVRGTSLNPGSPGKAVDMAVENGIVDDNALFQLLPALPWKADAVFGFEMFSGGRAVVEQRTLEVLGAERVTVPAGEFDAWRVEMTGGAAVPTFYIQQTAPHRVLKITVAGAPIEFVRVR